MRKVKSFAERGEIVRLTKVLREVTECLINWVEIADLCDRRDYDAKAIAHAKEELAKQGVSL